VLSRDVISVNIWTDFIGGGAKYEKKCVQQHQKSPFFQIRGANFWGAGGASFGGAGWAKAPLPPPQMTSLVLSIPVPRVSPLYPGVGFSGS